MELKKKEKLNRAFIKMAHGGVALALLKQNIKLNPEQLNLVATHILKNVRENFSNSDTEEIIKSLTEKYSETIEMLNLNFLDSVAAYSDAVWDILGEEWLESVDSGLKEFANLLKNPQSYDFQFSLSCLSKIFMVNEEVVKIFEPIINTHNLVDIVQTVTELSLTTLSTKSKFENNDVKEEPYDDLLESVMFTTLNKKGGGVPPAQA